MAWSWLIMHVTPGLWSGVTNELVKILAAPSQGHHAPSVTVHTLADGIIVIMSSLPSYHWVYKLSLSQSILFKQTLESQLLYNLIVIEDQKKTGIPTSVIALSRSAEAYVYVCSCLQHIQNATYRYIQMGALYCHYRRYICYICLSGRYVAKVFFLMHQQIL